MLRGPLDYPSPSSPSLPPLASDYCSLVLPPPEWHLDISSLLVGILVGLVIGPVIDLFIVVRITWGRWLQHQLPQTGSRTEIEAIRVELRAIRDIAEGLLLRVGAIGWSASSP